jgi:DNA-binding transcriptional ArsR family regulator
MRPALLVPFVGGAAWWLGGTAAADGSHLLGANSSQSPGFCLVLRGPSARRDGVVGWLGALVPSRAATLNSFTVSNLMMQEWGVQPGAKARALRALERSGLIRVERRGKRSPQVTLVVGNPSNGGGTQREFTKPQIPESFTPD